MVASSRRPFLVPVLVTLVVLLLGVVLFLVFRIEGKAASTARENDSVVAFNLLQLNDVYELTPGSGGAEGGLARVATVRNQLRERNPDTFTILAGDLLNPSALSTAIVDGEPLEGRQMVDVMNVLGLDYATFGNHEFDLSQEQLTKRLAESKFTWFSSNVTDAAGQSIPGVPKNVVVTVENEAGSKVRIGMFGVTIGSTPAAYVKYRDPIEVAKEQVAELRSKADVIIAVTHLLVQDDIKLAQSVPGVDLILGGHEHENMEIYRGADFIPIYKADANARTVQIHQLSYDTVRKRLNIESRLRRITSSDVDDPTVSRRVDRWVNAAFDGFRSQGFSPERMVAETTEELDGRASSVRYHPTRLTDLVALGMVHAAPGAELAIFNAGLIRIDDVLPIGEVTEYDIIRTLPFGGTVLSVQMSGNLLKRVLDQGRTSVGAGSYLQTANVVFNDGWVINGAPLDPARTYSVAINDFLMQGRGGLGFLTRENPEVSNITEHGDIRKSFIAELERTQE